MKTLKTVLAGTLVLAVGATAMAQPRDRLDMRTDRETRVDRAFDATGTDCEDITWSQETLQNYPNIASACREVMERDGKYYVRFEGEVRRVSDRGRQVTVDFTEGDRLTLTPPENLSVYMDGVPTSVRNLRPGDELNFYIPQDQLVATFFAGEAETAQPQEVPISPEPAEEQVAQAPPPQERLPGTASALPFMGAAGLLLIGFGLVSRLLRRRR